MTARANTGVSHILIDRKRKVDARTRPGAVGESLGLNLRPPRLAELRALVDPPGVSWAIADKARPIRTPVHMVERLNKVVHIERQLVQRLGREPRPDEIAEDFEMTTAEVREILRMAQHPISLEKPIGEEEELGDFVQDDQAESPDEQASLWLRREDIDRAFGRNQITAAVKRHRNRRQVRPLARASSL